MRFSLGDVSGALAGLVAAAAVFGLGSAVRLRSIPKAVLALVAFSGTWTAVDLAVPAGRGPAEIAITSPGFGQPFGELSVPLAGTVDPPSADVVVAVRSERDSSWWLWSVARSGTLDGSTGRWSLRVNLGEPGKGVEENYQVVALASSRRWCWLRPCSPVPPEGRHETLPLWTRSEPLAVRRIAPQEYPP